MPLSPFSARFALAAFLAIGGGIASNLLTNQTSDGTSSASRVRPDRLQAPLDTDRLNQLATDASRGPIEAPEIAPKARRPAHGALQPTVQRVGSFAPSADKISMASLPGVDAGEARRATAKAVQGELGRRGYEPGPADGTPGLVTRAAVMAYEHDQGLPLTADASPEVLAHLRHGTSAPGAAIGLDVREPHARGHAEQVIRAVQSHLGQLGYFASPPDGTQSDETVRAIREFEMDQGLVPSGRISGQLVARLIKLTTSQPRS